MIQSTKYNIDYYAKFSIIGEPCLYPELTVFFQDTDFGGDNGDKFLNISYNNKLLASCGTNNNTCNDFKFCFEYKSLGPMLVEAGEQIVIHIEKGNDSNIPYVSGCAYSLYADIQLMCREDFSM